MVTRMLTDIFGDYPQVKVIKLLISHPHTEYTKTDIAECANISRATLYRFWDKLEKYNVVKEGRKIANSQLYSVNTESEVVKALDKFIQGLVDVEIEEQKRILKGERVTEKAIA